MFRNIPLSNVLIIFPRLGMRLLVFSYKFLELQYNSMAFVAGLKKRGFITRNCAISPYYLPLNVLTASKGSNLYILSLLQLALCRLAALKSLPVHHP